MTTINFAAMDSKVFNTIVKNIEALGTQFVFDKNGRPIRIDSTDFIKTIAPNLKSKDAIDFLDEIFNYWIYNWSHHEYKHKLKELEASPETWSYRIIVKNTTDYPAIYINYIVHYLGIPVRHYIINNNHHYIYNYTDFILKLLIHYGISDDFIAGEYLFNELIETLNDRCDYYTYDEELE